MADGKYTLFEKMEAVRVPVALKDRQVRLAKSFVYERQQKGVTINDFCNNNNLSTKSWYDWQKNEQFKYYLNELQGSIITDDVQEAYQKVKSRILQLATAENASIREIELFTDHFAEVVEYEKRKAMGEMGILPKAEQVDHKTIEEKKADLLSRLKQG